MGRVRLWGLVSLFFLLAPSFGGVSSVAALPVPDGAVPAPVEAVGVIEHGGQPLLAELFLAIPPGADADEVAHQALQAVGARPMTAEDISVFGFTTFLPGGVTWGQFHDHRRQDDFVVQYYNPANDPTDGGGLPALLNTYETWAAVPTSSFRFEFGGVTDRPLEFLDGFNDMAWEEIGDPSLLGLTITAYSAEEIIEADVLMNTTASPFGWATDGRDYDVETVMLHENGHVLGLGHTQNPDAVMQPIYHGVARELGDDDIAGVSFLYPSSRSAGRESDPPSRSGPFRVVAELGDHVPDGEIAFEFELGDLNDRDDVAFATDPLPLGEGLYIARMGELTEVARAGRAAPGGGQYGLGILGRLDLDAAGNAAFAFTLDPFELPLGSNAGVFYFKRATGGTEALVIPYLTQAPGAQGPFLGGLAATLNDRGYVAFTGLTADGSGVYVYQPRAGIQIVAAPGSQAPGGETFDFASGSSLNIRGDVAFEGHTNAEPCLTLDNPNILINCYASVYVRSARTGEITRIAGQGDPAPGGGVFRAAIGPVLNDQGYMVFAGDLTPAPALVQNVGIFLASPDGDVIPVVRPGDEMPGGGRVVTTGLRSPEFALNNLGEVAFSAVLDTHSGPPGFPNDMGLYVWRDGEIRLVARTGTRMPEIGTIAYLLPPGAVGERPQFSGGLINNRGEVLFQATLTNGDGLLLIATGAAIDHCYDGLDPNGDDAVDSIFTTDTEEYGQILTAQRAGRLCPEMPTDRLFVDIPPEPLVVAGLFGATLRFDPALGDAEMQLFACDDSGCTQPLTPDTSEAEPGLRSFIWHNTTGQTQRVAVEARLTSGGTPALPYVLEVFLDLADSGPPPPPPPPATPCGDEIPSDDGAFFESPGAYGFVGIVCPDIPFNDFFTELPSGFRIDTVLSDPSSGGLGLSIYSCDALECAEIVMRATGESDDSGATQHASWSNCTGELHFVIIEVSYQLDGEPVPFELTVHADLNPAPCPP